MKGILQILPIEAFSNEEYGMNVGKLLSRMIADLDGKTSLPDEFPDWVPLVRAIQTNAMFSIEAKSSSMDIEMKFAPGAEGGSYKIKSQPRGEIEEGRFQEVITLPAYPENHRRAKIGKFKNRFLLRSSTPRLKLRAWIIGFDEPVQRQAK